jgi:hypothetical protein
VDRWLFKEGQATGAAILTTSLQVLWRGTTVLSNADHGFVLEIEPFSVSVEGHIFPVANLSC